MSNDQSAGNRVAFPVRAVALSFLALALLCLPIAAADAQVVWPRISLVEKFGGLVLPVGVTHAGDGSGNLYVVEQGGRIRLVKNGALTAVPFLDISGRVSLPAGEQGLLGLAFPPGFAAKRYFYVNYTRIADGGTVIARYRLTPDPDVADPASEEILLEIPQPFSNHNGGQLAFGPDGFLYIGLGDGGSGGDPFNNAQNPAALLGKMLRIDVESGVAPYAIPPSNPFVQTAGFRGEIWALGLRNPWRFSFDRLTGDMYIGDVGQNVFEEIDFQPAASAGGENYGWNVMEGAHCFGDPACSSAGLVLPVAEYDHALGCSVTGGFVYRGQAFPRMQGIYLYADFCSGRIWGLKNEGGAWQNALLLTVPRSFTSFGEDEAGNLYAVDYSGGTILEIVAPNAPPAAPAQVSPADGATGIPTTVTFRWQPSQDPEGDPVAYRLFLGTDPSFAGVTPIPVGRTGTGDTGTFPAAPDFVLLSLCALFLTAILLAGRAPRLAAALSLAGMLAASGISGCGGGGGGQAAAPLPSQTDVAHAVTGLAPNTTFFWKVAADDGLAATESPTRSFTTGN